MHIIFACDENPRDINTWSNIPYLLLSELEARGFEVTTIDLREHRLMKLLWRLTAGFVHRLLHPDSSYSFFRSFPHSFLTTSKLERALKRHREGAAFMINMSISHSPRQASIPVVLISDWTYAHYIESFLAREPNRAERSTIARDRAVMARASWVVTLFPCSADRINRDLGVKRAVFLGHPVNRHPATRNCHTEDATGSLISAHDTNRQDLSSQGQPMLLNLLFVGRPKYLEGLRLLLAVLPHLRHRYCLRLDVIGMNRDEVVAGLPTGVSVTSDGVGVRFLGYLSKADEDQRQAYDEALKRADLFISATPTWGPFSAMVEAMSWRTAVVTPLYEEFVAVFEDYPRFTIPLMRCSEAAMIEAICEAASSPAHLKKLQDAAAGAVAQSTWTRFVDRLIAQAALPATLLPDAE